VTWAIVWTRPAVTDLRRIDRVMAERVRRAIRRLAEGNLGEVTRLQGASPPEWRFRVGDWRDRFAYNFDTRTIEVLRPKVLRVRHRREAYRD